MFLCILSLLVIWILYKLFDYLIRLPRLGDLSSRYILVTGCDSGFGYEFVRRLDALGCHVFAGCLTEKGETEFRKKSSERVHPFNLDVSKHDSVLRALQFVKDTLPKDKYLWGLLNNAGVGYIRLGPCEWMTLEDYNYIFTVNTIGTIDVTMTFLPLIKASRGRIASTTSAGGRAAGALLTPYCVSKFGVEAFCDSLRLHLRRRGIGVSLIEPGSHKTNILNQDSMRKAIKLGYDQSSEDLRTEFNEQYADKLCEALTGEVTQKIISTRLSDVVDAYEHALLGKYPRARYVVGIDAKIMIFLHDWLPEIITDTLIGRFLFH